jgi:type IX secretion system PorP/SprF family membrane protein
MSDMAGQSRFTTNRFGLSIAYHQALDSRDEHFLGLGFQSEIWQRSINYTGLQWPNQNDNGTFNGSFPTGETQLNNNILFWDLSTGLLYTGKFGYRTSGYLGVAAQHLNRPVESLLNDKNVRLPMRFTAHGGVRFKLKGRFDMQPKFVYVNQGVSHEGNVGADFRFIFDEMEPEGNNFRFGAMFRMVGGDNKAAWKDRIVNAESVIISLGIEYAKVNLNLAYDINVSQLVNASQSYGAFELGLSYVGCFKRSRPQTIYCPKF